LSADKKTRVITAALERIPREELLRIQEQRLLAQVRRCYDQVPFYRDRWSPDVQRCRSLAEFKALVPFTSKQDFVGPTVGLNERIAGNANRVFEYHLTSGTSGLGQESHPLTVFDTEAQVAGWIFLSHWAGLEPGDRVAYTFPIALQQGGLWSIKAGEKLGYVGVQLGHYGSKEKLEHLLRFLPHGLVISPSYLSHLAALCSERGLDPLKELQQLKAVFIAGENYTKEWVTETESFWGCRVAEWYGLMQAGTNVAVSCERGLLPDGERGCLHLMEHRVLCEVLQPGSDEEVEPGEDGELVVTSLFREAFPVVRFRSNDRVRRSEVDCPCGRPFASIEAGTVARYDDMMKIRGTNVWPESVDRVVLGDARTAEYRGEVFIDDGGREMVRVTVEVADAADAVPERADALVASLQRGVKEVTGINMSVEVVPPRTLERFEFKVRRWTDHRQEGRTVVRHISRD
jgi:phenylacetate-CoA ligase